MRLNVYSDHVSNAKTLFSYKIRAIILRSIEWRRN